MSISSSVSRRAHGILMSGSSLEFVLLFSYLYGGGGSRRIWVGDVLADPRQSCSLPSLMATTQVFIAISSSLGGME